VAKLSLEVVIAGKGIAFSEGQRGQDTLLRTAPSLLGTGEGVQRSLAVVTPWYPSVNHPFSGSFVQTQVATVCNHFDRVDVYHTEDWWTPRSEAETRRIRSCFAGLLRGGPHHARVQVRSVLCSEAWLTRVPVPVWTGRHRVERIRVHENALRAVLPADRIEADVVHGHVGLFGGWLACRLSRPEAHIVVTEHASFTRDMLAYPEARAIYAQVLDRCAAYLCVSEVLRKPLVAAFPEHAAKIHVVPNIVPVENVAFRLEPVRELRHWLYVGGLYEHKGVWQVLEAFGIIAREDPRIELSMIGDGVLFDALRQRAAELGIGDRIHLLGPLPHDEVLAAYHRFDLLVHASRAETFGMTVVEALASGIPVLVTRCGGPEEVFTGIEGIAGELVPIDENPQAIVVGYRLLAARLDNLDLNRARRKMLSSYSASTVAEQILCHYVGERAAIAMRS